MTTIPKPRHYTGVLKNLSQSVQVCEPSTVIAVAANSASVQQGLANYLKASRFHAVAMMTSPAKLAGDIDNIRPSAVIIEISMHSMEGFEAIAEIRRNHPTVNILVLADYIMPSLVKMIFKCGADGYLLAMPTQANMLTALDAIRDGNSVLDKHLEYIRFTLSSVLRPSCITV